MSFLRRAVAALASVIAVASSLLLGAAMAQTNTQPANASFETPSLPLGRTLTPAGASWTFAGTAGIERLQSGPCGDMGGFSGQQVAYLSSSGTAASLGSVSQTINFPQSGYYYLRFQAGRLGASNAFTISVGGNVVDTQITPRQVGSPGRPLLEAWWTMPFNVASPGNHEIKFKASSTAATLTAGDVLLLDQVMVAYVPAFIPNGSFESSPGNPAVIPGWTIYSPYAAVEAPASDGAHGSNVARARYAYYGSMLRSDPITIPAGRYSISARLAKTGSEPGCQQVFTLLSGNTSYPLAAVGPAEDAVFLPYTSSSADIAAGTYVVQMMDACSGSGSPSQVDAVILNRGGPNFSNSSFETPDLDFPVNTYDVPRQDNPAGAGWTFAGSNAGIQGNPGINRTNYPRTGWGKQYGDLASSTAALSQSLAFQQGTFATLGRFSDGLFNVSINGAVGEVFTAPTTYYNNTTNASIRFGEMASNPFVINTAGDVPVGLKSAWYYGVSVDGVATIQLSGNLAPNVAIASPMLAPGKSYALVHANNASAISVTVTANDADGLQPNGIQLQLGNTQIGGGASTSPASFTLPGLTPYQRTV